MTRFLLRLGSVAPTLGQHWTAVQRKTDVTELCGRAGQWSTAGGAMWWLRVRQTVITARLQEADSFDQESN